jgi:hypothetical protein
MVRDTPGYQYHTGSAHQKLVHIEDSLNINNREVAGLEGINDIGVAPI